MKIHGKTYVEVKDRILEFRNNAKYKGWMLRTDITHLNGDEVIMKAFILDADEKVIATGIASETRNSSNINKTSHIENCETSAWGRALANLGIGVIESVASYDEVAIAISGQKSNPESNQGPSEKQKKFLESKGKWVDGMTKEEASKIIGELMSK